MVQGERRALGPARLLLWLAMPLLGLANQYLAVRTAHALAHVPFGPAWFSHAARTPWVPAWVGLELVTLAIWMTVLAELSLSAAFPVTALGYVLVVGLGWTVLHEPFNLLEIVGGAAILIGVWLIGDGREQP
jgi:drug/metabolite transporter (DMT)-like permease